MKAKHAPTLTLRQRMVLAGFDRPIDLIRASEKFDDGVPQGVLSQMLRGAPTYPLARDRVAKTLRCTLDELDAAIAASAAKHAADVKAAK